MVLVDQSVKALPAFHRPRSKLDARLRPVEVQSKMWSLAVVVLEVILKNLL